ncbi:hypothetical protein LEP1GSC050_0100 [Leptospira phage vB_LbrZ_5399-LE1]|uniref:Phage protein n=1 Tax=Leptospira inadai serovar Lyme TaxID=293084 RepID=A0ABX4YGH2_9LEPT|nr:hypothetical protein [Leptospira inadai]AGS80686.1 hypothetical protein LEP1GSC050_0100 [Leptospira phage vB_LbrZ_5399-LE1]PNV74358.1 hypothetical protein BES34_014335 [Leptospira inadai serovar Lyme]
MNILNPKREIAIQGTFEGDIYEFDAVLADESKKTDIEIAVGKRLQGVSLESISDFRYGYILAVQTLNYVVTSFPEKFSKLRSFEEIDDHEFILELITDYRTKEAEFRSTLKKNNSERGSKKHRDDSRSIPNEGVKNLSERSNELTKSIPGTETISPRSSDEPGLPGLREDFKFTEGEGRDRKEKTVRVYRGNKPELTEYPRKRRVLS